MCVFSPVQAKSKTEQCQCAFKYHSRARKRVFIIMCVFSLVLANVSGYIFVCMFSLSPSLSLHTVFFSTAALHKHEKGSCSAISAIQATRDQGFNQKIISSLKKTNYYEELIEEGSNTKP